MIQMYCGFSVPPHMVQTQRGLPETRQIMKLHRISPEDRRTIQLQREFPVHHHQMFQSQRGSLVLRHQTFRPSRRTSSFARSMKKRTSNGNTCPRRRLLRPHSVSSIQTDGEIYRDRQFRLWSKREKPQPKCLRNKGKRRQHRRYLRYIKLVEKNDLGKTVDFKENYSFSELADRRAEVTSRRRQYADKTTDQTELAFDTNDNDQTGQFEGLCSAPLSKFHEKVITSSASSKGCRENYPVWVNEQRFSSLTVTKHLSPPAPGTAQSLCECHCHCDAHLLKWKEKEQHSFDVTFISRLKSDFDRLWEAELERLKEVNPELYHFYCQ